MSRRSGTMLTAVLALALVAAPAVAAQEQYVSIQSPSFSWTGKQDQQASYSWSATVSNPFRRAAAVKVTLLLLDGNGNVVGSSSVTTEVAKNGTAEVSGESTLAYAQARLAAQYKIAVEGAEAS